jgi:hypothetical protein
VAGFYLGKIFNYPCATMFTGGCSIPEAAVRLKHLVKRGHLGVTENHAGNLGCNVAPKIIFPTESANELALELI